MKERLYLEERIAIVRKALNEQTLRFADQLPRKEHTRDKFNAFILTCIGVLDGYKDDAEHLKKLETE